MYDPANNYWKAEDGRIFSSAKIALVEESDLDFVAWLAAGYPPTLWPRDTQGAQTSAALQDVLTPYGLYVDPKQRLLDYLDRKWSAILEIGIVSAGGFQSSTGEKWQGYVSRAVQLSDQNPGVVIKWNGTTPITNAQLHDLGAAVGVFVQASFEIAGDLEAQIEAGIITTTAEIDAAEWPKSN